MFVRHSMHHRRNVHATGCVYHRRNVCRVVVQAVWDDHCCCSPFCMMLLLFSFKVQFPFLHDAEDAPADPPLRVFEDLKTVHPMVRRTRDLKELEEKLAAESADALKKRTQPRGGEKLSKEERSRLEKLERKREEEEKDERVRQKLAAAREVADAKKR